jgi:hypothetical protein
MFGSEWMIDLRSGMGCIRFEIQHYDSETRTATRDRR